MLELCIHVWSNSEKVDGANAYCCGQLEKSSIDLKVEQIPICLHLASLGCCDYLSELILQQAIYDYVISHINK